MMMTREQMIDRVVRVRGLEDKYTIWFCELEEDKSVTDETLLVAMIAIITIKIDDDEE